jgi:predicted CopG family antitoxin
MATKTISLRLEAYDRLRRAKKPGESFSDVVMRARWDDRTVTAAELLRRRRERGPLLSEEELDRIEALRCEDRPPDDKWRMR